MTQPEHLLKWLKSHVEYLNISTIAADAKIDAGTMNKILTGKRTFTQHYYDLIAPVVKKLGYSPVPKRGHTPMERRNRK